VFICSIWHYLYPSRNRFLRASCTKNLTSDDNNSNADSLCYAAIVSTAERFLVLKVSKLRPEIHQQVATVNHLCMVDHVKFLMHLRLYGMLQHNHWGIDGWVPFAKYWGPGPQDWCTSYVATEHRHVRQDSLPVNVSCRRDSLSVTDSGSHSGTLFEAPIVNFCVTKFRQNSGDISKKMACAKFWPHVIRGPFPAGALRACVPCLMVNPALLLFFLSLVARTR